MSLVEFARAVTLMRAYRRLLLRLSGVIGTAFLAACTTTAPPIVGADPSDPNTRVRPVAYRSALGSYSTQRPVSPADWREQNERVAPRSGQ
jgi:hypothetical protein